MHVLGVPLKCLICWEFCRKKKFKCLSVQFIVKLRLHIVDVQMLLADGKWLYFKFVVSD